MATPEPKPPGYLESLRELGDGVLASVQDRIELFSLEAQEEKFRLIRIIFLSGVTALTGMLALLFGGFALAYCLWPVSPGIVLGGLACLAAGCGVLLVVLLRRDLSRQPRPFAGTREEIAEDRACIRKTS